MGGPIKFILGE